MGPRRRDRNPGQDTEKPPEIIPEKPATTVDEKDAEQLAGKEKERQKRRRRRIRAYRSFLLRTILLALVVYILFFHVVGLAVMPSGDMSPRLDAGDLLLYYRIEKTAKSRDIVVIDKAVNADDSAVTVAAKEDPGFVRKALDWLGFKDPDAPKTKRFVCRVIACAGDTVNITEEGGLTVNGNSLVENYIYDVTKPYEGYVEYPVVLKEGEYFVLSDMRNGGSDSRFFGPVKQEEILGIVITILRRSNL